MATTVRDNPTEHRYEVLDDDQLAGFVVYEAHGDVVDLVHTETLAGFAGRGMASTLVRGALDDLRRQGRQVRPFCPFVRRFITEHPEDHDLVPAGDRSQFGLEG